MLKRFLSCVAAFCLAASLIPATALAEASFVDESRLLEASDAETYTVTLNLNGGTLAGSTTLAVAKDSLITDAIAVPTRDGMRFAGWYANPQGAGLPWFNVLNDYKGEPVTGNMTLYANWVTKGFDRERDGFDFANIASDFFSDTSGDNHRVTGDFYTLVKEHAGDNWNYIAEQMNKAWGGSCFGIAAVASLIYAGRISPDFLKANAITAHDVSKPVDSSVVRNALEYYYLEQCMGKLNQLRWASMNEHENITKLIKTLQAEKQKDDPAPVIVGLGIYKGNPLVSAGGHALVAYDITETESAYEIDIWDSNDPSGLYVNKLTVNKSYSSHSPLTHLNADGTVYECCPAATFNGFYDTSTKSSFIKYAIPVSAGYDDKINIQNLIAGTTNTNGASYISRTVQLAADGESDSMFEVTVYGGDSVKINSYDGEGVSKVSVEVDGGEVWSAMNCTDFEVEMINEPETIDEPNKPKIMQVRIPCADLQDSPTIKIAPYGRNNPPIPEMTCRFTNSDTNRFINVINPAQVVLENWVPNGAEQSPASVQVSATSGGHCEFSLGCENEAASNANIDRILFNGAYTTVTDDGEQRFTVPSTIRVTQRTDGAYLGDVTMDVLGTPSDTLVERTLKVHPTDATKTMNEPIYFDTTGEEFDANATGTAFSMKMLSDGDFAAPPIVAALAADRNVAQAGRAAGYDAFGLVDADGQVMYSSDIDATVSFHSMGGTPLESRTGGLVDNITAPTREGFLFDGWSTTRNGSIDPTWTSSSRVVSSSTDLYAHWSRDPNYAHRVTLRENDAETIYLVTHNTDLSGIVSKPVTPDYKWDKVLSKITQDVVTVPTQNTPVDPTATAYAVSDTSTEGTVSFSPSSAAANTTVKVSASASGKRVEKVTVKRTDGSLVTTVTAPQSDGKYAFVMPASNVEVSVSFVADTAGKTISDITVTQAINGTLSATVDGMSATRAAQGSKVTITATPDAQYKLNSLSASANGAALRMSHTKTNEYSFTMPASPVSIAASFKSTSTAVTTYTIVPQPLDHGKITSSATTVAAGTRVEFTVTPNEGYEVDMKSITVDAENGTNVNSFVWSDDVKPGSYVGSFTMPASNVSIRATTVPKSYTVTCSEVANGTITATPSKAKAGEQVTVNVVAATGYEIDETQVKVIGLDGTAVAHAGTNGTYTFTMPTGDVTVSAGFKKKSYAVSVEVDPNEAGVPSVIAYVDTEGDEDDEESFGGFDPVDDTDVFMGSKIAVEVDSSSTWELLALTYTYKQEGVKETTVSLTRSEADDYYRFTMPAADVKIKAVFAQKRDDEAPYLKFKFEGADDITTKTIDLSDDLILQVAAENVEENTEWANQLAFELSHGGNDVVDVKEAYMADGLPAIQIVPKKTGTITLKAFTNNMKGGQAARLNLTVNPYRTVAAASASSSDWEKKTSVSIGDQPKVAKALAKEQPELRFRVQRVDDPVATQHYDIIKNNKDTRERLVYLVDLSFVDAAGNVVNEGNSPELNKMSRTVTFPFDEEMTSHAQRGHGFSVVYVNASVEGGALVPCASELDSKTSPTELSFTTDHFSTFAIMATGTDPEPEVVPDPEPEPTPNPEPTTYGITLQQSPGGTIKVEPERAAAGTTVTLTATPVSDMFAFNSATVSWTTDVPNVLTILNSPGTKGEAVKQFEMPAADVTISASFSAFLWTPPTTDAPQTNPDDDTDGTSEPDDDDGEYAITPSLPSPDTSTRTTQVITVPRQGTTTTAGAGTANANTSLVKTGDQLTAASVCTGIMAVIVVSAIVFLCRQRARKR